MLIDNTLSRTSFAVCAPLNAAQKHAPLRLRAALQLHPQLEPADRSTRITAGAVRQETSSHVPTAVHPLASGLPQQTTRNRKTRGGVPGDES